MKCEGCGRQVQCAQFGPADARVWLGYSCGCCLEWDRALDDESVSWRDVRAWAQKRRKQVAT